MRCLCPDPRAVRGLYCSTALFAAHDTYEYISDDALPALFGTGLQPAHLLSLWLPSVTHHNNIPYSLQGPVILCAANGPGRGSRTGLGLRLGSGLGSRGVMGLVS